MALSLVVSLLLVLHVGVIEHQPCNLLPFPPSPMSPVLCCCCHLPCFPTRPNLSSTTPPPPPPAALSCHRSLSRRGLSGTIPPWLGQAAGLKELYDLCSSSVVCSLPFMCVCVCSKLCVWFHFTMLVISPEIYPLINCLGHCLLRWGS